MSYTEKTNIVALKDNTNISGSSFGAFFVGSTTIDEDLYYYYMTETEDGFKQDKILAKNTYIKYTTEIPNIETVQYDFKNKSWYWLCVCTKESKTILHIPTGSIFNDFNVDLE